MDVYFEEETSPSNSSNLLHRGPKIFVSTLFKASAVFDHFSQMHPTLTRLRFLQDGFSFGSHSTTTCNIPISVGQGFLVEERMFSLRCTRSTPAVQTSLERAAFLSL